MKYAIKDIFKKWGDIRIIVLKWHINHSEINIPMGVETIMTLLQSLSENYEGKRNIL